MLAERVRSVESAFRLVNSFCARIVLNHSLMRKMLGLSVTRISRDDVRRQPYSMLLKSNPEFEALNNHLFRLLAAHRPTQWETLYDIEPSADLVQ